MGSRFSSGCGRQTCLIQTDDNTLRAFDSDGKQQFAIPLPAGEPGRPVLVGESIVLAGKTGWLVWIDPIAGQIVSQTDLEQPDIGQSIPDGNSVLVPGKEGVIYVVRKPAN